MLYQMKASHTKTAEYRATWGSQKLWVGCFGSKFNFLSPICDSTTFYNGTQKRLNTEPQGVPEDRQGSIR